MPITFNPLHGAHGSLLRRPAHITRGYTCSTLYIHYFTMSVLKADYVLCQQSLNDVPGSYTVDHCSLFGLTSCHTKAMISTTVSNIAIMFSLFSFEQLFLQQHVSFQELYGAIKRRNQKAKQLRGWPASDREQCKNSQTTTEYFRGATEQWNYRWAWERSVHFQEDCPVKLDYIS